MTRAHSGLLRVAAALAGPLLSVAVFFALLAATDDGRGPGLPAGGATAPLGAASPGEGASGGVGARAPAVVGARQDASDAAPLARGAASTGTTPAPAPLTVPSAAPQVVPFVPPLWDGAVVATQQVGVFASPATLDRERQTWIHWAVRNTSEERASGPYVVSLRLDGEPLANWQRLGLKPGAVDVVLDWPIAWNGSHRFMGAHRLTLEVMELAVPSRDMPKKESVFREFVWEQKLRETPEPLRRYSPEELRAKTAVLGALLNSRSLVSESADLAKSVLDLGDVVYYALYGKSLYEESLQVHLLDDAQFPQWVAIECTDRIGPMSPSAGVLYGQACRQLSGAAGYAGTWRSWNRIALRSGRPPAEVLLNLAHELGHFRQSLLRPDFGDRAASLDLYALREAQAYAHETLFIRTLEELAGYPLLLYPRTGDTERMVDLRLSELEKHAATSEHARGRLLVWMIVLTEPSMVKQQSDLFTGGQLSREGARGLLAYLLAFSAKSSEVEAYVGRKLGQVDAQLPTIGVLMKGRLVTGLPPGSEGPFEFSEMALLSP
ncbi:MAG: hypothetical protein FJ315_03665 [SAR202 cluster bacterium]|nr:hypothetical protein [SAR202 cluster bacterium]